MQKLFLFYAVNFCLTIFSQTRDIESESKCEIQAQGLEEAYALFQSGQLHHLDLLTKSEQEILVQVFTKFVLVTDNTNLAEIVFSKLSSDLLKIAERKVLDLHDLPLGTKMNEIHTNAFKWGTPGRNFVYMNPINFAKLTEEFHRALESQNFCLAELRFFSIMPSLDVSQQLNFLKSLTASWNVAHVDFDNLLFVRDPKDICLGEHSTVYLDFDSKLMIVGVNLPPLQSFQNGDIRVLSPKRIVYAQFGDRSVQLMLNCFKRIVGQVLVITFEPNLTEIILSYLVDIQPITLIDHPK